MDTGVPTQPVGVYGWRKRCLYSFMVLLMVVVIVNLALTVWILRVLDFSIDGMGKLRIVPKGVRLEGEAEFLRPLYVQEMRAEDGQVMRLESARGIKMQARGTDDQKSGSLVLGNNKLKAECEEFQIVDNDGNLRLSVTEDDVTLGVDDMKYPGEAVFEGSVQTPTLRGPNDQSLQVQSENSKVEIAGGGGVSLLALAGDVQLESDDNVRLQSCEGSIFLEAESIYMKNILVKGAKKSGLNSSEVYQLCMCSSDGRLFLGDASGDCIATDDTCPGS